MSRTAVPSERPGRQHALTVLLIVLGVLACQGLMHWVAVSGIAQGAGPLLALLPVLLLSCWALWRQSRVLAVAVLLALIIGLLTLLRVRANLSWLFPAPHVAVYLFLLWWFGRTLRAGREPLVTFLARQVHGALPPEIALYTRRVTVAWCVFFAFVCALSLLLFAWAPLPVWSWFDNVLNLLLIVLMFAAEYAYRLWRFPNFSHASFLTSIRVFRNQKRASAVEGR